MEEDIKKEVEEPKVEEAVPEENKPYQVQIEDARQDLFKNYSKARRISNILMFVVLAAIVGIMFMIMSNIQWLKIVGYCSAGAILLGMILYYVLTRKRFPDKTRDYISFVSATLRNKMFDDQFDNVSYNEEEKFELADFASDGVYKDATGINSRNIVRAEYKGHHLTYGEVALLRPSTRKQQVPPLFVGRYVTLPNDLQFDGRFVIVYKNNKQPFDLPNNVEDLVVLEDKDDITVYGPEGADFRKTVKGTFLTELRKIKVENNLYNIDIVIWGGHSAAYISYDDVIMSFPFDKPFNYEAFEQSYKDLQAVIKLLAGE